MKRSNLCSALLIALLCHKAAVSAVIEGVTLDNKSGKPMARVRVSLEAVNGASPAQPIYTNSSGAFRFENLKPGSYQLLAERGGFVPARFGQSRYDAAGSPISLGESSHFFAQVRLQRPPLATGMVVDENGIGMPGFSVSAYRIGTRPRMVAAATSDDRGRYSFLNLGPGRYVFQTGARLLDDGDAVLPTFYGGTARYSQAKVVELALDSEVERLDIVPQPGALRTISGRVNAPGVLAVQLLGDLGVQQATVDSSGGFQFRAVPAGRYGVLATATASQVQLAGYQEVEIGEEDRFVSLELVAWPTLALRCQTGDGVAAPAALTVFFERENFDDGEQRRLDCNQSLALPPGTWLARLMPLSGRYVRAFQGLESPRVREEGLAVRLASGARKELVATMGGTGSRITGKVVSADGHPAIGVSVGLAAADDDNHRRMGGARLSRTGPAGEFRFDGLAPGDYRILSGPGLDSLIAVDSAAGAGKTISIQEGKELDLEIEWRN